jgi:CspA family cold shock protein
LNGSVKWFNGKKGYGFITPAEGDKDVFVHYTAISVEGQKFRTLYEGDKVTFETVQGEKGLEAKNVVITEAAPRQRSIRKQSGFRKSKNNSSDDESDEIEEDQ